MRIMNRDYTVEFTSSLPKKDAGTHKFETAEILVYPSRDRQRRKRSFWHEIWHCYTGENGYDMTIPEKYEEICAELFSITIADLAAKGHITINVSDIK